MTLGGLSAGQRDARFAWSVVPPLLASPALPALPASLLLVAGFSAHYWQDRRLAAMAAGGLAGRA